jgi:aconitate hydratase
MSVNSFGAKTTLQVGDDSYEIFRLDAVEGSDSLPYSLKILLENLLRTEDGANITADDIRALAGWEPDAEPSKEIQFTPARVIMQDFTGVPCVVDLATMREAMEEMGGDPAKINPLAPAELVIDHSVIADVFGTADAFARNVEIEYGRNRERYQFLRWGQTAFDDFKVVPPGTGIVHQVNIEHLARVIFSGRSRPKARPRCTPIQTPASARIHIPRWSTASVSSAGASAGSRPRRPCSASRCRCSFLVWLASSSLVHCVKERPQPILC